MKDTLHNLLHEKDPAQQALLGLLTIAFSFPCVLAMVHDIIMGVGDLLGAVMAGGFFSVVVLIGLFLVGLGFVRGRANAETTQRLRETQVLTAAEARQGRLTIAELALEPELSVTESADILEAMERAGLAYSAVSEEGQVVYVFPAFDTPDDKHQTDAWLDGTASFDQELESAQRVSAAKAHPADAHDEPAPAPVEKQVKA